MENLLLAQQSLLLWVNDVCSSGLLVMVMCALTPRSLCFWLVLVLWSVVDSGGVLTQQSLLLLMLVVFLKWSPVVVACALATKPDVLGRGGTVWHGVHGGGVCSRSKGMLFRVLVCFFRLVVYGVGVRSHSKT